MARIDDLRRDYDLLGEALELAAAGGSAAAASIARERRMIAVELEKLEAPEEVPFVDELASRRTGPGARRPPGRRKSG